MVEFSKIKKTEKVADLGSGNGKIVVEFAKLPAVKEVHGFEINPFLVWFSRRKIKKLGLQDKAFIHLKNFWNEDLSEYGVISIFQVVFIMKKLERKLKRELKKGSRIVSNTWKFPNLKIKKHEGKAYLYEI
jgi:protein-L-isoaspartate O-methyltransferase|tara:strand:+ start:17224 stop:17616 length:393 start_codon:yes stop_codon:yes gene_type:complete